MTPRSGIGTRAAPMLSSCGAGDADGMGTGPIDVGQSDAFDAADSSRSIKRAADRRIARSVTSCHLLTEAISNCH